MPRFIIMAAEVAGARSQPPPSPPQSQPLQRLPERRGRTDALTAEPGLAASAAGSRPRGGCGARPAPTHRCHCHSPTDRIAGPCSRRGVSALCARAAPAGSCRTVAPAPPGAFIGSRQLRAPVEAGRGGGERDRGGGGAWPARRGRRERSPGLPSFCPCF